MAWSLTVPRTKHYTANTYQHTTPSTDSMSSKHVMNDSRNLVNESLAGLVRLNPALKLDQENRLVHLAEVNPNRVALVRWSIQQTAGPSGRGVVFSGREWMWGTRWQC